MRAVNVPKLKSFNCEEMYTKALDDELISLYLPAPTEKKIRGVSRKFLFDVSLPTDCLRSLDTFGVQPAQLLTPSM